MIFVLLALGLVLLALRWLSPVRYAVHAARADNNPKDVPKKSPWVLAGLARDERGHPLDLRGKFIGQVAGRSMMRYGMPAGATFVADELRTPAARRHLKPGDIVVVDAPAKYSSVNLRLRCIKAIHDDEVEFEDGHDGRTHTRRPLEQVRAKVKYVFDSEDEVEPSAHAPFVPSKAA